MKQLLPPSKATHPQNVELYKKIVFVDTFLTNSLDLFDCDTLVEDIYDAVDSNVSERQSDEFSLFGVLGMIIGYVGGNIRNLCHFVHEVLIISIGEAENLWKVKTTIEIAKTRLHCDVAYKYRPGQESLKILYIRDTEE